MIALGERGALGLEALVRAGVELDEEDPASIERFRCAMQPIDEYRAMRDGKEGDAPVTFGPEPTPAVDPTV